MDIGANIGQTAIELTRAFPQATIHSFEPHTPTYEILKQKMSRFPKVNPYNLGFGAENSDMLMNVAERTEGNSLLKLADNIEELSSSAWTKPIGTTTVQIRCVDTWCAENGISQVDILKIDTQGYELPILRGGERFIRPPSVRAIYLEMAFVPTYEDQSEFIDLYLELTNRGYHLVDFYSKVRRSHYLAWCDALFIS
jgi:FkbM family methyltransferase